MPSSFWKCVLVGRVRLRSFSIWAATADLFSSARFSTLAYESSGRALRFFARAPEQRSHTACSVARVQQEG